MTAQIRNNEMVNLLRADFQARYEPNFAWEHVISEYLNLPGLRAFYPFTSVNESGNLLDISGQARLATNTGTPLFYTENLITYAKFDGATQYFSRADEAGLDLLGNEAYINPVLQGITVTAWIRLLSYAANNRGIITKNAATLATSNYFLGISRNPFNTANFTVFSGANAYVVESLAPIALNQWYFIAARFDPSTAIYIRTNTAENINNVGIPASLNNVTASMLIANASGGGLLNCDMTLAAICTSFVPSAMIESLFQQTRAAFNV